MSHSPAEILIIQNIQLLEQSRALLENTVEKKFFDTIDQIIKHNTQSSDKDFIGVCNFYEDQTWFLSNDWSLESFDIENSKTHNNLYAYYALIHEGNNDTNYWRLSNFFRMNTTKLFSTLHSGKIAFPITLRHLSKNFAQNKITNILN